MDHKFTQQIKEWLEQHHDERDYATGALFLLKLSGNQIMYRNLIANPSAKAEQVVEMEKEVEQIVAEHIPLAAEADECPAKGKRADHDSLPDEIKAKYVENLSLLQRMRELHLRLRSLSLENSTCPDSERYPFLKELIALDKKLHANWEAYDHYVASAPKATPKAATRKKESAK